MRVFFPLLLHEAFLRLLRGRPSRDRAVDVNIVGCCAERWSWLGLGWLAWMTECLVSVYSMAVLCFSDCSFPVISCHTNSFIFPSLSFQTSASVTVVVTAHRVCPDAQTRKDSPAYYDFTLPVCLLGHAPFLFSFTTWWFSYIVLQFFVIRVLFVSYSVGDTFLKLYYCCTFFCHFQTY